MSFGLDPEQLELLETLRELTGEELDAILFGERETAPERQWRFQAHAAQVPPDGDWRVWLFLGGRGSGKTAAGARWLAGLAERGECARMALVGPTFHDVREVMIDGPAGVRSGEGPRPEYEASRRKLVWPNGAEALAFSSEDPEALRGPQFDAAWGDEFCYWTHVEETMSAIAHGLRLGEFPRLALTTTPRPIRLLRALTQRVDVAVTQASTWDNARGLSPAFLDALRASWRGSAAERRELLGEYVEDPEGALWTRAGLEASRAPAPDDFDRIVVAVDPPVSVGPSADACGIVAAGAYGEGRARRAVVLADATIQGATPRAWAERAASLAEELYADAIVAEANNGGELVRTMLRLAAPEIPVRLVHARDGKFARAQPVAALYEQGRVTHAAALGALEDEMCGFGAGGFQGSPDRLDALVWAITDLLLNGASPRLRAL